MTLRASVRPREACSSKTNKKHARERSLKPKGWWTHVSFGRASDSPMQTDDSRQLEVSKGVGRGGHTPSGQLCSTGDVRKGEIMYLGGALLTDAGFAELPMHLRGAALDLRKRGKTWMMSVATIDALNKVEPLANYLLGSRDNVAATNQVYRGIGLRGLGQFERTIHDDDTPNMVVVGGIGVFIRDLAAGEQIIINNYEEGSGDVLGPERQKNTETATEGLRWLAVQPSVQTDVLTDDLCRLYSQFTIMYGRDESADGRVDRITTAAREDMIPARLKGLLARHRRVMCGTDVPGELWDIVTKRSFYKAKSTLMRHVPSTMDELWGAVTAEVKSIIGGWEFCPSSRLPTALAPVYTAAWALMETDTKWTDDEENTLMFNFLVRMTFFYGSGGAFAEGISIVLDPDGELARRWYTKVVDEVLPSTMRTGLIRKPEFRDALEKLKMSLQRLGCRRSKTTEEATNEAHFNLRILVAVEVGKGIKIPPSKATFLVQIGDAGTEIAGVHPGLLQNLRTYQALIDATDEKTSAAIMVEVQNAVSIKKFYIAQDSYILYEIELQLLMRGLVRPPIRGFQVEGAARFFGYMHRSHGSVVGTGGTGSSDSVSGGVLSCASGRDESGRSMGQY